MLRRIVRLLGLPVRPPTPHKPQVTVEYRPQRQAAAELQSISGIGQRRAQRLIEAGITSLSELAQAEPTTLAEQTGLSEKRLKRWIGTATDKAVTEESPR